MSSNEGQKDNNDKRRPAMSFSQQFQLHFTAFQPGTNGWRSMAQHINYQGSDAAIIVSVSFCYQMYDQWEHYVVERTQLCYVNKDNEDRKYTFQDVRWRVFRYEGKATKENVLPVSRYAPSQPYAEIIWERGAVATIGIYGLEHSMPRGYGIGKEAVLLSDAVDVLLRLSPETRDRLRAAAEARRNNAMQDEQKQPALSEEEKWLAQACPAARDIGGRGKRLSRSALANELKVSENTITNRKKDFPEAWPKIEAAHAKGMRERLNQK